MKNILIIVLVLIITGCTNNHENSVTIKLNQEIEQLKTENTELKNTIELLKYPSSDRFRQIKEFIANNDITKASEEIKQLKSLFPQSTEALECNKLEVIIVEKQAKIKAEKERIKALGFKALKEVSTVEVFYNKITIGQFSIANTFTFDAYDDSWHLFTADRGNKYISARITITSTDKDPKLPVFYAYRISGDKLICEGSFRLRFARWEDYATYLGNYNDNSNDFSKTATIPFKIGIEISDEIASSPLVVICRKQNCMTRDYDRFANPPVSYSIENGCTYDSTLTMDDLKKEYAVVKVLNRNKI